jgi:hypothetical protein
LDGGHREGFIGKFRDPKTFLGNHSKAAEAKFRAMIGHGGDAKILLTIICRFEMKQAACRAVVVSEFGLLIRHIPACLKTSGFFNCMLIF